MCVRSLPWCESPLPPMNITPSKLPSPEPAMQDQPTAGTVGAGGAVRSSHCAKPERLTGGAQPRDSDANRSVRALRTPLPPSRLRLLTA